MSNFYSHLFGSSNPFLATSQVKCSARDPNNCRYHKTGRFAQEKKRKWDATNEDDYYTDYLKAHPSPPHEVSLFLKPHKRTAQGIEAEIEKAKPSNLEAVQAIGNYTLADGSHSSTRISPLTGKPISNELNTVMNALMCGLDVTDEEIYDTPEWSKAEKAYQEFTAKAGGDQSKFITEKEREELIKKFSSPIVTHELNSALKEGESYTVRKGFRLDIITGLPAGGKNKAFADRISRENYSRMMDADVIKTLLPLYGNGLGAKIVHDDSTYINKDLILQCFQKGDSKFGDNIVYPTLGVDSNKLIEFAEWAHRAGYTVHFHFNEIDVNKAKGRMLLRIIETGRFLPLHVFYKGDATQAYQKCKNYADSAEWYRSDAGKGIKPKKIEEIKNANPKRAKFVIESAEELTREGRHGNILTVIHKKEVN